MRVFRQKICPKTLIPFRGAFELFDCALWRQKMGFAKGSIWLSPAQDIPMLLQVLHAQFITHDQLRQFARLRGYELNDGSFNWRVRRLVENGLLERHSVRAVTPKLIYSITNVGKLMLADHFPVMDSRRHKDAASHVNLIHSLELNRLHLSLAEQGVLVDWESEMTIRAKNELTSGGYVKNYDAVVTVNLRSRQISFALEYERSPKKPRTYARIRSVLEQEDKDKVSRFLYIVPEEKLAWLLLDCFYETTAAIYIGLSPDFMASFLTMEVFEAASSRTTMMIVIR
jgi:hypothetical protein